LTVITHPADRTRGDTRYIGKTVQFSRTAQRGRPRDSRSVSQNSTACGPPILSTDRQSRLGMRMRTRTTSSSGTGGRVADPVDMARTSELHGRRYADACAREALQSWRLP
jgi:hypothetical protein